MENIIKAVRELEKVLDEEYPASERFDYSKKLISILETTIYLIKVNEMEDK